MNNMIEETNGHNSVIRKRAYFSECKDYRYFLSRSWPPYGDSKVTFVMLNPSTADASVDDPTIKRCMNFAKDWGYEGIFVLNLYALRSAYPSALWKIDDPVGPDNDIILRKILESSTSVVCAWGNRADPERVSEFVSLADDLALTLRCLGTVHNGMPVHPLYIPRNRKLEDWNSLPFRT